MKSKFVLRTKNGPAWWRTYLFECCHNTLIMWVVTQYVDPDVTPITSQLYACSYHYESCMILIGCPHASFRMIELPYPPKLTSTVTPSCWPCPSSHDVHWLSLRYFSPVNNVFIYLSTCIRCPFHFTNKTFHSSD
jgi:hypothetical protein